MQGQGVHEEEEGLIEGERREVEEAEGVEGEIVPYAHRDIKPGMDLYSLPFPLFPFSQRHLYSLPYSLPYIPPYSFNSTIPSIPLSPFNH